MYIYLIVELQNTCSKADKTKGRIKTKYTIMTRDFKTQLSITNRTTRQKMAEKILSTLPTTLTLYIYMEREREREHYPPKTAEYTFFPKLTWNVHEDRI